MKTGRDVIIQALLGAEEFGFATSALIVLGCVMMRKCHLNTCPMGVTTQNEELRRRFIGRSEYLINFFTFLAQEVREWLAEMGFTRMDDIIGRSDLLVPKPAVGDHTIDKLDLSRILYRPVEAEKYACRKVKEQSHHIDDVIDQRLIKAESGRAHV